MSCVIWSQDSRRWSCYDVFCYGLGNHTAVHGFPKCFSCVSYCAVSIIPRQPVSSLVLLTAILILMAVFVYPRLSGDYLTLRVSRIDTREFHTTVSVVVRLHVHFRSCRN